MKVLVIDDEDDIRRIARVCLTRMGNMEVIDAADAAEGLRRAETERPDVVLLDVLMPGTDGPAVLQALRRREATRDIPVVFLTGRAREGDVESLKALGAAGVLPKPFDPLTLAERLRAVLAGS